MKCPKCGREYDGTKAYCDVDGTFLVSGESSPAANEPDAVSPGFAPPPPVPDDAVPPPVDLTSEITQQAPPRMVEPIAPSVDDVNARLRAADVTYRPEPRHRLNVPLPPSGAPVPHQYAPARPHPPAQGSSNPWKVAFLAMIGVLAIGGILFWLLRSNPNATNANTPPLASDPSASPVVPASPPTGTDESQVPTVATPPPYTDANANNSPSPTPTPVASPNVDLPPPDNTNLPTPVPTPKNTNQNSNSNNNSPGAPPPATPRPSPATTAPPRPNPTARPIQPAGPPK